MQRPTLQRQDTFSGVSFEIPRQTNTPEQVAGAPVIKRRRGDLPVGYRDITQLLEAKGLRRAGEQSAVGVSAGTHADEIITALFDYPTDRSPLEVLTGNDHMAWLCLCTLLANRVLDEAQVCAPLAEQNGLTTDRLPHALMVTPVSRGVILAERIQDLEAIGFGLKTTDSWGRSAAVLAARTDRRDALAALVENRVDITQPDGKGKTALHHAIKHGAFAACQFLLEHTRHSPLIINPATGQSSPLHSPAAFINRTDRSGRSALHFLVALPTDLLERAPAGRAESVIEMLMSSGADLDLPDSHGRTPLDRLARYGSKRHFELLQAHLGGEFERLDLFARSLPQGNSALMKCLFKAASNDQKHRMIRLVSFQKQRYCKRLLSELSVDLYVRDRNGLSIAASTCGRIDEMLNRSGATPAIEDEFAGLMRLIEAGMRLNAEEKHLVTRSMLKLEAQGLPGGRLLAGLQAAGILDGSRAAVTEYLRELTMILSSYGPQRCTATDIAFNHLKNLTSAGLRLPADAQSEVIRHAKRLNTHTFLEHARSLGWMPSHEQLLDAIERQSLAEVRNLIRAGADLLERDRGGLTALHQAILVGNRGVIEVLIEAGGSALIEAKDAQGRSPLVHAIRRQRYEAVLALGQHGASLFHAGEPALKAMPGGPDARMKNCFHAAALGLGTVPGMMRDVTRAYHRISLACHPDKHAHSSPQLREQATARMVLANNARDHFRAVLA